MLTEIKKKIVQKTMYLILINLYFKELYLDTLVCKRISYFWNKLHSL